MDEQIRAVGRPKSTLTEAEKKERNKIYMKKYYEEHREQMTKNAHRTYQKNSEIIKNHTNIIKT